MIAAMQLRVSQRDCPVTVGRRDHIAEATLIGTAIASFSRPVLGDTQPALSVMPLARGGTSIRSGVGANRSSTAQPRPGTGRRFQS